MEQQKAAHSGTEERILREEQKILAEVKAERADLKRLERRIVMTTVLSVLLVGGLIAGAAFWKVSSDRVYIEKAEVSAPKIDLAPSTAGILQDVSVQEGDQLAPNTVVARVGDELIKSTIGGSVISVNRNIGKLFNRGESVVSVIDPGALRVVGRIGEDKGLKDIRVGQRAVFTVDAFGSKQYEGVVDEIAPTSREGDVVFNISDKRQTKEFNVKVRFDPAAYPELKGGMSARIWVYLK